jgi:S-adenosylmethionine synthetase
MFGFACDDTPVLMPFPAYMANRLARRLGQVRKDGTLAYLRPDGKTQVTLNTRETLHCASPRSSFPHSMIPTWFTSRSSAT